MVCVCGVSCLCPFVSFLCPRCCCAQRASVLTRRWSNGQDSSLPRMRSGFDSSAAHIFGCLVRELVVEAVCRSRCCVCSVCSVCCCLCVLVCGGGVCVVVCVLCVVVVMRRWSNG